jgi:hypothetical protein
LSEASHQLPLYWQKHFHDQFQTDNFIITDQNVVSVWHRKNKTFYSGFHGPFGGFYSEKNGTAQLSQDSINHLLGNLRIRGEENHQDLDVRVRLFPEEIFPIWGDSQLKLLTAKGFNIDYSDTAHYIMLDTDWRDAWRRDRSRDFKKSVNKICGSQIATDCELSELYDVITKNAEQKNRKFSLGLEDLKRMSTVLSAKELELWIYKSNVTGNNVAAAICQIVDHKVIYIFRWGHVYNYKDYGLESSPMTFVADHLCKVYSNRGYTVLYVGTSSYEGVLDENLAHFKESLGALRTSIESVSLKSSR